MSILCDRSCFTIVNGLCGWLQNHVLRLLQSRRLTPLLRECVGNSTDRFTGNEITKKAMYTTYIGDKIVPNKVGPNKQYK